MKPLTVDRPVRVEILAEALRYHIVEDSVSRQIVIGR